jgi:hypothetical protein
MHVLLGSKTFNIEESTQTDYKHQNIIETIEIFWNTVHS